MRGLPVLPRRPEWTGLRRLLMGKAATGGGTLVEYTATGNPAAFQTNVSKPLVSLEMPFMPVQDLHGYANPWPAGGGVNRVKLSEAFTHLADVTFGLSSALDGERIKITGTYSNTATNASFRIGYLDTTAWDFTNLNIKGFVVSGITSSQTYSNVVRYSNANKTDIAIDLINLVIGQEYTIIIDIVFYEGSTAPTAYSPYSNLCPISGWTGAVVTRTGKNLFDLGACVEGILKNDGTVVTTSTGTVSDYILLKAGQYTASRKLATDWWKAGTYDLNKSFKGFLFNNAAHLTDQLTISEDCYIRIGLDYVASSADEVQLELGSATAYAPYTGQSYEVTFPALGKNLLQNVGSSKTERGVTFTVNSDGSVLANGTNDGSGESMFICTPIKYHDTYCHLSEIGLTGGVAYTLSGCPSGGAVDSYRMQLLVYGSGSEPWDGGSGVTFTFSDDVINNSEYRVAIRVPKNVTVNNALFKPMICLASDSAPTTFEPYTRTAYGGTVEFATGTLTVDRASVDLGTLTYIRNESQTEGVYFFVTPVDSIPTMKVYSNGTVWSKLKSETYKITTAGNIYNGTEANGSLGGWDGKGVRIRDDRYTTPTELITALTGSKLVFEVQNPVTIQLTPQQITALKGDNVVWSDTNGTNVITYLKKE